MMIGSFLRCGSLLLFLLAAAVLPVPAQSLPPAPQMRPLVTIGSPADDSLRVAQLLGRAPTAGYLLRSPAALTPPLRSEAGSTLSWEVVAPELRLVWNSDLPFSLNDGAMWAGRGTNLDLRAGVRARAGSVSLTFAPQLIYHQNQDVQILHSPVLERSPFASPWHTFPESIDLPLRFGERPFTLFDLGQSTLAAELGPVVAGVSTENQWWGPGIRNAIVMSNHAAGPPHLFLRTASPVETRYGDFEAKWMLGVLTESIYFDRTRWNPLRSLSGVAFTFQPAIEPDLTLGFTRVVYAPSRGGAAALRATFNALRPIGRPNDRPATDLAREPGPDQLFSLFGRWVFPRDGFEAYAEWARHEAPRSLRDFLVAPHHTQGYTLGLQWARPLAAASVLRLQGEVTNLEESATFRQRRVTSFYTSRPVPQGYTQRGQVIGASIGPGASSQWAAADLLAPRWQLGVFGGRIRWENDSYYFSNPNRTPYAHDVSVFGGLRAGVHLLGARIDAELTTALRYNYLFQNPEYDFRGEDAVDIWNRTLRLRVTPTGLAR